MALIRVRETLRKWMELQTVYGEDSTPHQMTYEDLAVEISVSESLFRKIMSGHANVTTNVQMKLCERTRLGIGDLFEYDPNGKPGDNGEDKEE